MPALTFLAETGTGSATSNSYATVAEADNFLGSHLSGGTFAAKTTAQKETLLIMAARLLDNGVTFKGYKTKLGQAMQWPREFVTIDRPYPENLWPNNSVPNEIKTAQMEVVALLLIGGDRTADADADGIASVSLGKGAVAVTFDANTAKSLLGRIAPAILADYAISISSKRGMAPVRRA